LDIVIARSVSDEAIQILLRISDCFYEYWIASLALAMTVERGVTHGIDPY
jgi:hypothetical protein